MKKKKILSISLLLLILTNIYSIGFDFHTLKIRTSPDFASNTFPTSLIYQFDFPIPDIKQEWPTEIDFRIDNGMDFRELRQHPDTGDIFAENPTNPSYDFPKSYITIYDELNIVFAQGLFDSPYSNKNELLKLWFTFDLRFENAYERFEYLYDSANVEGLFLKSARQSSYNPAVERFPDSNWIGQPELVGNRSTTSMSCSLGFDINLMKDSPTVKNGMNLSVWTRLNPLWFDAFEDGSQDFFLLWSKLDLAFTPFKLKMNSSRDLTWLSLVLDNSTTYRFITGNKVPYYVQGGFIAGSRALNTEHIITNRTSLTLYGPQINSYDCFPYIQGYFDVGFSFGNLLNSALQKKYVDAIYSIGLRAELVIFNMSNIYYELGYVINDVLNTDSRTFVKFGFSFGV